MVITYGCLGYKAECKGPRRGGSSWGEFPLCVTSEKDIPPKRLLCCNFCLDFANICNYLFSF